VPIEEEEEEEEEAAAQLYNQERLGGFHPLIGHEGP
jgi:hypothetical protein